MKSAARFAFLGLCALTLHAACGSSDDKKKAMRESPPGGEGGEAGDATAGTKPQGGKATGGTAGSGDAANGGANAGESPGGAPDGAAGASGAGGEASGCPTGTGECDGNPDTVCEQDLTLLTSCGDCTTTCVGTNGTPSCDGACHFACEQNYGDCDNEPDNGCEQNLLNDDKNCGACGHDCSSYGATCSQGMCNGVALQQGLGFGSDNSGARTWAFDPTYGLFANGFNSYGLYRLPLDGSAGKTIWTAVGKTSPTEGMTLVDNYVYWAERGAAGQSFKSVVYKKLVTDDASVLPTPAFVPEWSASFLQRQGNSLYWCSGGYQDEAGSAGYGGFIYGRALDAADGGTKLVTVDQGNWGNFKGLGVTGEALYWVTDQNTGTQYELRTAPLAGAPITVVPAVFNGASLAVSNGFLNNGGDPVNLIPVGNYIYFNRTASDAFDGVYRYKKGLAKPEQITLGSNIHSMLVDATYVYFIQLNAGGIWRAPINNGMGGAAVQITASAASKLIGVDATYVYYATIGCCQTTTYRVLK